MTLGSRHLGAIVALVVACSCAACSPFAVYAAARSRAAAELICPETALHPLPMPRHAGYTWAFEGCGHRARVHCMQSAYEIVCTRM